jgi:hypothetical protein
MGAIRSSFALHFVDKGERLYMAYTAKKTIYNHTLLPSLELTISRGLENAEKQE